MLSILPFAEFREWNSWQVAVAMMAMPQGAAPCIQTLTVTLQPANYVPNQLELSHTCRLVIWSSSGAPGRVPAHMRACGSDDSEAARRVRLYALLCSVSSPYEWQDEQVGEEAVHGCSTPQRSPQVQHERARNVPLFPVANWQ